MLDKILFRLSREKIVHWGFRPCKTRTNLLNYNAVILRVVSLSEPKPKTLIRLCGCAGWSKTLLSQVFRVMAQIIP